VPFLFLSGYGRESLPQAFRHTSLLSKPFSQRQLVDACARLLCGQWQHCPPTGKITRTPIAGAN